MRTIEKEANSERHVEDVVIIIPAYNPDEKFISFLKDLTSAGYSNIIVVNDGSRENTKHFFDSAYKNYGCIVLTHAVNLGQGRAYKTAFNYYLSETKLGGAFEKTIGIIQCDCDGQHHIDDINKCVMLLKEHNTFILGVRDFSDKSIPFRSRFGNNCTSFVFRVFCGLNLKDTQTGLKGIPKSIIPVLMETRGERFEYASSVLLEVKRQGMKIIQFPIQTIYINGNESSHFNPVLDSIRIYSLILRYLMSSLSGFVLDILFYALFIRLLENVFPNYYIVVSTYLSRIILSIYVFIVNKKIVFRNNGKVIPTAMRFFILCICQATVSGFSVRLLVGLLGGGKIVLKLVVDTLLFFVSYRIQDDWVFKNDYSEQKLMK